MPLFQPTNITPSSFAGIGGGTVDANDNIVISWQVNGNVPMYGFKVDIQSNDAASTAIGTINRLASEDGSGGINEYDPFPFNGIDEKGNYVIYTFSSADTWSSLGLENGKSYKMLITQQYLENNVLQEIEQYAPSVFITRSKPSLVLRQIDSPVASAQYTFGAIYNQEQGDGINWCRWILALNENGTRTIMQDTGEIYTYNLSYSYNGFLSDQSYSVMCIVETQNGVQATTGWIDFNVSYSTSSSGELLVSCTGDSSASITIPPSINEIASTSGNINIDENGELVLRANASATWSDIDSEIGSMVWKGDATGFRTAYSNTDIGNVYAQEIVYVGGTPTFLIIACGSDTINLNSYRITVNATTKETSFEFVSSVQTELDLSTVKNCTISVNASRNLIAFHDYYDIYTASLSSSGVISNVTAFEKSIYENGMINYVKFVGNNFIVGTNSSDTYTRMYTVSGATISSGITVTDSQSEEVLSTAIAILGDYIFLGIFSPKGIVFAFQLSAGTITNSSYLQLSDFTGSTGFYQCSNIAAQTYNVNNMLVVGGIYTDLFSTPAITPILKTFSFSYSGSGGFSFEKKQDMENTTSAIKPIQNPNSWSFGNGVDKLFSSGEAMFEVDYANCSLRQMYKLPQVYNMSSGNSYIGYPSLFYQVSTENRNNEGFILGGNGLFCYDIIVNDSSFLSYSFSDNSTLTVIRTPTEIIVKEISYPIQGDHMLIAVSSYMATISWINNGRKTTSTTNTGNYFPNNAMIDSMTLDGYQNCEYVGASKEKNTSNDKFYNDSILPTYHTHNFYSYFSSSNALYLLFYIDGTLYRKENNVLKIVGYLNNSKGVSVTAKDYSIKSNQSVSYQFIYESRGQYSAYLNSKDICMTFNGYYLIEASLDESYDNQYNVLNIWKFGNNISAGSVSNNNTPTWLTNFTPYRLRQLTSRSGKSGTLQALLSNVSNSTYSDTAAQMEELYALSKTQNTLFLKDMKGNLYMVAVSAPIVQTINTKTAVQQVTVSIPWEEVGDASDVSIIGYGEETGS